LSKAAFEITSIRIPEPEKSEEKVALLSYLRLILPENCARGHNFHLELQTIADNIRANLDTLVLMPSDDRILPNENTIIGIFGHKLPTLKDLKKLNSAKLLLLAAHLSGEMGVEIPVGKKELLCFCQLNFWRINNLWEDVKEAMIIAQKAFVSRVGEFKRTMKNLLRVVNEQFGGFSMKFRMNFVINGLLNFVEHFSDSHTDCPRFFWWSQCTDTHVRYKPAQDYCTLISAGWRGPGCRDLISVFFRVFVYSFVMSRYCENQLWKCISFSKTTVCESYFHWKGIMIPKWQNVTPSEYDRKEIAAFIAFSTRQREKRFLLKKLVKSKYAATLTVATGHKNNRYERHILDAVLEVCGSDSTIAAAVEHYTNKYSARQKRRESLQEKVLSVYEQDATAQNLNLGPVKHQWRTSDSEGCISGKEYFEKDFSARPVPPFPFIIGELLDETEHYRIRKVWESSRALKRGRNEEKEDNQNEICTHCEENVLDDCLICECGNRVHTDCFNIHTTEWEICENGNPTCKNCSSTNRMGNID
jgi:hypothetical protein